MAKRRVVFTEAKIEERIRLGYGQGECEKYKPWLMVGDFPSSGRSQRISGNKTGRVHHFFSDLEEKFFYLLEWADDVLDIREQFPLFPVTETEQIALNLGYRHPKYIDTKISTIMTTDFLITCIKEGKKVYKARSIKYANELEKTSVKQKQKIEQTYWMARSIEWKLVTEQSTNFVKSNNIKALLKYFNSPPEVNVDLNKLSEVLIEMILNNSNMPLSSITQSIDNQFQFKEGVALSFFRYLAARKIIPVNIEENLLPTRSVEEIINVGKLKKQDLFVSNQEERLVNSEY